MNPSTLNLEATLLPDGQTLQLNEKIALPPGRVTVTVQVASTPKSEASMLEVLDRIHGEQEQGGHVPMTEEEMEAEIANMRNEDNDYEERWREIWSQTRTKDVGTETP
jgi:hypothetical protein